MHSAAIARAPLRHRAVRGRARRRVVDAARRARGPCAAKLRALAAARTPADWLADLVRAVGLGRSRRRRGRAARAARPDRRPRCRPRPRARAGASDRGDADPHRAAAVDRSPTASVERGERGEVAVVVARERARCRSRRRDPGPVRPCRRRSAAATRSPCAWPTRPSPWLGRRSRARWPTISSARSGTGSPVHGDADPRLRSRPARGGSRLSSSAVAAATAARYGSHPGVDRVLAVDRLLHAVQPDEREPVDREVRGRGTRPGARSRSPPDRACSRAGPTARAPRAGGARPRLVRRSERATRRSRAAKRCGRNELLTRQPLRRRRSRCDATRMDAKSCRSQHDRGRARAARRAQPPHPRAPGAEVRRGAVERLDRGCVVGRRAADRVRASATFRPHSAHASATARCTSRSARSTTRSRSSGTRAVTTSSPRARSAPASRSRRSPTTSASRCR